MVGVISSLLSRAVANLYAFKATQFSIFRSSSVAEYTFFGCYLEQIWCTFKLPTETTIHVDIVLSVGLVLADTYRKPAAPCIQAWRFWSNDCGLGIGITTCHGTRICSFTLLKHPKPESGLGEGTKTSVWFLVYSISSGCCSFMSKSSYTIAPARTDCRSGYPGPRWGGPA